MLAFFQDFDFAQDTSSNEKLRIIADDYRETLKKELKAVSTKFAFRFRKNVRHPDRDTTIFYLVLASKSHAALNNMKMAMAQYVQKAGLWGELAYSDYYEVKWQAYIQKSVPIRTSIAKSQLVITNFSGKGVHTRLKLG